jgi:hypothetical protein
VNPIAAISHVLAIALGVLGGFWVVGALTPDTPDADVEPGIEIPVEVEADEEESLFNPGPLSTALAQISEQEAAGTEYALITITPSSIDTKAYSDVVNGFELSFLSTGEPMRVIELLANERPAVSVDQVSQIELVATSDGPVWYVTTEVGPFRVAYGTDEVEANASLPQPVFE